MTFCDNTEMKKWILLPLLLVSPLIYAKTKKRTPMIKVAIVDTGLDIHDPRFAGHICPKVGANFVIEETLADVNSHGTHVAGLIVRYAEDANYCLMIYKYFRKSDMGSTSLYREVQAIKAAIDDGADIINLSEGGTAYNEREAELIRNHPEILFVVAAGNESLNMDIGGNEWYPASLFLPNMVVVGNKATDSELNPESNYGSKVRAFEIGTEVYSTLPGGYMGYKSGTSQATAIRTGKIVKQVYTNLRRTYVRAN